MTLYFSTLVIFHRNLKKTIIEEFIYLLSYCSANKLSVNFNKTHYMIISSAHKVIALDLHNIKEKITLNIEKNLNCVPHIQHINSKVWNS